MNFIKILLVEDDASLGYVVEDNLTVRGYNVVRCADGLEGEKAFLADCFHLCILDVMLPKKDGFSLARSIRKRNADIPIIFLTAKGMVEDKLTGFQTGADDYITKPFSLEELFCRIEVFLRRTGMPATRFGRLAAHDPRFVLDLRNGRIPRAHTEERIEHFMNNFSGEVRHGF